MKTTILILSVILVLSLLGVGLVLANNGVELPRWVLSGGASDSSGGDTTLRATLGQPVVGGVSGGDISLGQGYWYGATPDYKILLPMVLRSHQP